MNRTTRRGKLTALFSILMTLFAIAAFATTGIGSTLDSLFIDQWIAASGYVAGYFSDAKSDDDVLLSVETWTGGANDSNWTSNGNWSGIGGAGSGDDLVFPASASRKTNVNDFANNTAFNSITISGNDYSITGAQIFLSAGIVANQTAAAGAHPIFAPNIILNAPQTFTATSRLLNLNGVINTNGHLLTVDGAGSVVFNGQITGTGHFSKTGTGTMTINGNSAGLSGVSTLDDGKLVVSGSMNAIQMNGGVLSGTGSVGTINANLANSAGTIAPGTGGTTSGTLISTGNVLLKSTVNFEANLNGTTVGTLYDRLTVTGGDINLNGANLTGTVGFTPSVGNQFTIIATSGVGNSVLGQFAQGNTVVIDGQIFTITYNPTSVVLTSQGPITSLTWDGGGSTNNWSEAANWNPDAVPVDGITITLPAGAPVDSLNQQNDIVGLDLASITLNSAGYLIGGNPVTVSAGITMSGTSSSSVLQLPITLAASQAFTVNSSTLATGSVDLNGFSLTVDSSTQLSLGGTVSGTGTITKTGAGNMTLQSFNTFFGPLNINSGVVSVITNGGLGASGPGNATVVANGGSLHIANNTTHSETLTLNGTPANGALVFEVTCNVLCALTGPITLASNANVNTVGNGNLGAAISESGGARTLTKFGVGNLKLFASNSYSGTTTVNDGTLTIANGFAVNTNLVVGDGIGGSNADVVRFESTPNALGNVQINSSGLIDVNGANGVNIGSLAGSGNLNMNNGGVFVGGNPINTTFSGIVSGGGNFSKTGSGTLTLTGANTFSGQTSVTNGGFVVNGTWPGSIGTVAGTVGGTGQISGIANGGPGTVAIAPGGSFPLAPGVLNVTGAVALGADRTFVVDIGGTTAGTQYDRLSVGGTTNLAGANLVGNLISGFVPTTGQQFTILQSTGAITGQFAQGSSVFIGGRRFSITYLANSVVLTALAGSKPFDFDGDGKSDISIFRPSNGQWWLNRSTLGTVTHTFGTSTDKLVPGDYTGDGVTDVAIYRPGSGEWFVLRSENFTFFSFPFGNATDVTAPGDYDGDGKTDAAVFRPSTSTWFIQNSGGGTTIVPFGASTDLAVPADYDGDGKTDIAIYRPSNGQWWLNRSTLGIIALTFGTSTDKCVPGDYTGDGKADVAIWRPSTGEWFVLRSENFTFFSFPFGISTDNPSPGDYDGDGKIDAAVFRSSSATWFIQQTGGGGTVSQSFGASTDIPVPATYVR